MARRHYEKKPVTAAQEFARLVASVSYEERLKTVQAYFPEFNATKKVKLKNGKKVNRKIYNSKKGLTAKQKQKVTRYYKDIRPYLSAPIVKQKLRNAEEASAAWRWLHGREPPHGTLFVPIHEAPLNKPRLKFKEIVDDDGNEDLRVTVSLGRGIEAQNYFFDDYGLTPEIIAKNPDATLAKMLDDIGAPRYAIVTGDHLFANFASRKRGRRDELRDNTVYIGSEQDVIKSIRFLQNMYNDKTKNNYWGNWLMGVKAYFFNEDSPAEFNKYRKKVATSKLERVEIWREVRSLNRKIKTANDQIKTSDQEIKYYQSRGAKKFYGIRQRTSEIKANERFKKRAEQNLQAAMRKRAQLIMTLTDRL